MPSVTRPANQPGEFLVDYEEKVFPDVKAEPGEKALLTFHTVGGKVYACRFALQALYGHGEGALTPGIKPISPLDVLDIVLMHRKEGAFILDTWTL